MQNGGKKIENGILKLDSENRNGEWNRFEPNELENEENIFFFFQKRVGRRLRDRISLSVEFNDIIFFVSSTLCFSSAYLLSSHLLLYFFYIHLPLHSYSCVLIHTFLCFFCIPLWYVFLSFFLWFFVSLFFYLPALAKIHLSIFVILILSLCFYRFKY